MFSTCLTCHQHLGANQEVPSFPVGRRLAFDSARGRLWVVCVHCGRWNLTPLEERWEAIESCERLFRGSHLRASTDNIGMAQLPTGLELIRIGPALRTELAAWRYGRRLRSPRVGGLAIVRAGHLANHWADRAASAVAHAVPSLRLRYKASIWVRIHRQAERVIDAVPLRGDERALIRYRHLENAELIRPGRLEPWRLLIHHEQGTITLSGEAGLRSAGKLLSAVNGSTASDYDIRSALQRLEDAGDPEGYFARVAKLALRTSWGRTPDAPRDLPVLPYNASVTERLALYLTNRSFWARGGTGSEPHTLLPHLPFADRLALEMAAHEDSERRALEGELADLEAAWREAEEIAAIADGLFLERSEPTGWWPMPSWLAGRA